MGAFVVGSLRRYRGGGSHCRDGGREDS